ncbi:MAG: hypothetical protein AB2593_05620 [Candidatus Thiodiazotropha sp.]
MAKKKVAKKKVSKKKTSAKRTVARPYPRRSLEEALKVPMVLKDFNGGNPWSPEEVAKGLGLTTKNSNSFFYLTAASRDFGLTEGTRDTDTIQLSEFGRSVAYAPNRQKEEELLRQAFTNVDLFRRVLEYYKGSALPELKYLSNTLENEFGLDKETHEEFINLFRQNAELLNIGANFDSQRRLPHTPDNTTQPSTGGQSTPDIITLAEPEGGAEFHCFVIMPFREREEGHNAGFFDEVLRSIITPSASGAGFVVTTANREGSDVIQSTIVNNLLDADLVVADLTEHNPNVLFELGMRMAFDKPVALIRAKGTGQIFDVDNMLRVYEYDPSLWPSTVKHDVPHLRSFIRATWKSRESARTYLKILRQEGVVIAGES